MSGNLKSFAFSNKLVREMSTPWLEAASCSITNLSPRHSGSHYMLHNDEASVSGRVKRLEERRAQSADNTTPLPERDASAKDLIGELFSAGVFESYAPTNDASNVVCDSMHDAMKKFRPGSLPTAKRVIMNTGCSPCDTGFGTLSCDDDEKSSREQVGTVLSEEEMGLLAAAADQDLLKWTGMPMGALMQLAQKRLELRQLEKKVGKAKMKELIGGDAEEKIKEFESVINTKDPKFEQGMKKARQSVRGLWMSAILNETKDHRQFDLKQRLKEEEAKVMEHELLEGGKIRYQPNDMHNSDQVRYSSRGGLGSSQAIDPLTLQKLREERDAEREKINKERKEQGLPPLALDQQVSLEHSNVQSSSELMPGIKGTAPSSQQMSGGGSTKPRKSVLVPDASEEEAFNKCFVVDVTVGNVGNCRSFAIHQSQVDFQKLDQEQQKRDYEDAVKEMNIAHEEKMARQKRLANAENLSQQELDELEREEELAKRKHDSRIEKLAKRTGRFTNPKEFLTPLSCDASLIRDNDYRRIENAGVKVINQRIDGNPEMDVTREFGRFNYKDDVNRPPTMQKIVATPDVQSTTLHVGDFAVLASNSMFDSRTKQQVSLRDVYQHFQYHLLGWRAQHGETGEEKDGGARGLCAHLASSLVDLALQFGAERPVSVVVMKVKDPSKTLEVERRKLQSIIDDCEASGGKMPTRFRGVEQELQDWLFSVNRRQHVRAGPIFVSMIKHSPKYKESFLEDCKRCHISVKDVLRDRYYALQEQKPVIEHMRRSAMPLHGQAVGWVLQLIEEELDLFAWGNPPKAPKPQALGSGEVVPVSQKMIDAWEQQLDAYFEKTAQTLLKQHQSDTALEGSMKMTQLDSLGSS